MKQEKDREKRLALFDIVEKKLFDTRPNIFGARFVERKNIYMNTSRKLWHDI